MLPAETSMVWQLFATPLDIPRLFGPRTKDFYHSRDGRLHISLTAVLRQTCQTY